MAQHLAECQAHAMIVVLDTRANWFPLVRRATVQPLKVAPKAPGGFFQRLGPDGESHERRHHKRAKKTYEVNLR